jgi:hypothetical protein
MMLVTSLGQAFVHGIFLMHHRLPQGKQGCCYPRVNRVALG